jgi:hypothetical protein
LSRSATITIECASAASVLRPWPVPEHPRPGSELGGHVQHPLPAGQQPLRQRAPDTVRALHRPDPVRPLPRILHQQPVTTSVGRATLLRAEQTILERCQRGARPASRGACARPSSGVQLRAA